MSGTLTIDGTRLLQRIAALADVGADPTGGVSRTAFSPAFVEGRALVERWCLESGLDTTVDAVGNLVARYGPKDATRVVVVGSHLDTVTRGGALDGAYGVLAGLAALEALSDAGSDLPCGVLLAGFVNEEGAGGTTAMTGSRALAGRLGHDALDELDASGTALGDLLVGIGGDPERLDTAALAPGSIAAYLECHIEQGPVLEARGDRIGVVTAITGRTLLDAEVVGDGGHAGTVPMTGRRDALVAAAHLVLAVEALGDGGAVRVATAGQLSVAPGTRNQIPERVRLLVELRDEKATAMADAVAALKRAARAIEETSGVRIQIDTVDVVLPAPTDEALSAEIANAAARLELPYCLLPSGAGHDAQSFSGLAPIAMVFVPSVSGISHLPEESTAPNDLVAGAAVLADTVLAVSSSAPAAVGR